MKPLKLDKKELLKKYKEINGETTLEQGKTNCQGDSSVIGLNSILEKTTLSFFPKRYRKKY